MAYTTEQLYQLLPAIYRIRDAERGLPLKALIAVLTEQAAVMEADIDRLYENWFIETCDEWVVPYIGDLLGVRGLCPVTEATFSQRARVANTIGYRRRKGTASMVEQLARDTTGWPARVVEFFQLLETTQYANHIRLHNLRTPDLRQMNTLDLLDTPFDTIAHTADVRHIENGRGKHNIMNIGIFLWRLQAYPISQALAFSHGDGMFSFSQLGQDIPLFTHPVTETDPSHLAEEINVPTPIRRWALLMSPSSYYGAARSLRVLVNGVEKPMVPCNLGDWLHRPASGMVAVDPALGRLAFATEDEPDPATVQVDYYYGFSSEVGGGCYKRTLPEAGKGVVHYAIAKSISTMDSVQKAIIQWTADGRPNARFEIQDNHVYQESVTLSIPAGISLEIRASDQRRPVLRMTSPLSIKGEAPTDADQPGGRLTLDGLLLTGHPVKILDGDLGKLQFRHCTMVPGLALNSLGFPVSPEQPSITVLAGNERLEVSLERTITGGVLLPRIEKLTITDSLVHGTGGQAIASTTVVVQESTVFGDVLAELIEQAGNSIFTGLVTAERKQEGCIRFCYLPLDSSVPRRFHCQPGLAVEQTIAAVRKVKASLTIPQQEAIRQEILGWLRPSFTDRQYGQPGYGQLGVHCPEEIRKGADDQTEMGVFHHLKQPQREANLRASLTEYLRVGLEAGIFYMT